MERDGEKGSSQSTDENGGLEPDVFAKRYPRELFRRPTATCWCSQGTCGKPDIILMDEPFGALDPITREQLQDELLRIQDEMHKTIVFVTHDMDEALKLGDRIAIMKEGELYSWIRLTSYSAILPMGS